MSEIVKLNTKFLSDAAEAGIEIVPPPADPDVVLALAVFTETAQSWMLPSQIDRLEDLKPGTWLVAEVDNSVALSPGVQYGYDFNWVREAKLLGLAGDIGLRLQVGVSAALSFNASGHFAVVIGRDPKGDADLTLRFRLFRLRRKGWGCAFDAGVSVRGDFDDFLPEFDEFVKAVCGVHGAQVLKDLKAVEKWTNPDQGLAEILGEVGVDYGLKLPEEVTGIDPETAFDAARDRLVELVDKWNDLPHSVATQVWKLVEEHADLDAQVAAVKQAVDAGIDGDVEQEVRKPATHARLKRPD